MSLALSISAAISMNLETRFKRHAGTLQHLKLEPPVLVSNQPIAETSFGTII